MSLKTLAVALRRTRQPDEAAAAYVKAHEADPADMGCLLDAAAIRQEQGQWAEALRLYERVLARQAHPWAVPSAHYCRFKLTGDLPSLEALRAIGHRPPALGEDDMGSLIEGLIGNPAAMHDPRAAAEELMAKLEGASDLDRERARELLRQIDGEVVEDDDDGDDDDHDDHE
jgi:tetratricopeptide (TPR) repeat protein